MKHSVLLTGTMLGCVLVSAGWAGAVCAAEAPGARLVEARRIWDAAPHNAFTDLIRYQEEWLCVFREGQGHVSPDGAVRVIASKDGRTWASAALITSPDSDLRDPKITITPKGELMLTAAGALHPPATARHQTFAWFSRDPRQWGKAVPIGDPDFWLWRVSWHGDVALGLGYRTVGENVARLYRSKDGRKFETVVPTLVEEQLPNESSIVFELDGTALCLLRREGQPGHGLFGTARAPYTNWEWKDVGMKIGGPHLLRLPDGRLIAAVRFYDGGARTAVAAIDRETGRLRELLRLPSGGDTSYPGLVWHDGLLWVSYYSSHEGKTSIYLAHVRLGD
jgi:hypothetical protein